MRRPPITTRTRLLGVAGHPVEHSLSPAIQNAALEAAGLDYVYLAFSIAPQDFDDAVKGFAAAGMAGLNCTVPHKNAALALCFEITEEAHIAQAVNTLTFTDAGLKGANTDVEGFVETLRHDGSFEIGGRTVVQFGAGGAGRGMALGAIQQNVGRLRLVNRTIEKADALAADLRADYPEARIETFAIGEADEIRGALAEADLVVNATSLGLAPEDPVPWPVEDLSPDSLVFDAAYTAEGATAWLRSAAARGCSTLHGLGMLVRQGAASFRIWTGVEPDLDSMFRALPHDKP